MKLFHLATRIIRIRRPAGYHKWPRAVLLGGAEIGRVQLGRSTSKARRECRPVVPTTWTPNSYGRFLGLKTLNLSLEHDTWKTFRHALLQKIITNQLTAAAHIENAEARVHRTAQVINAWNMASTRIDPKMADDDIIRMAWPEQDPIEGIDTHDDDDQEPVLTTADELAELRCRCNEPDAHCPHHSEPHGPDGNGL